MVSREGERGLPKTLRKRVSEGELERLVGLKARQRTSNSCPTSRRAWRSTHTHRGRETRGLKYLSGFGFGSYAQLLGRPSKDIQSSMTNKE